MHHSAALEGQAPALTALEEERGQVGTLTQKVRNKPFPRVARLVFVVLWCCAGMARAQQSKEPDIAYFYPAGLRQGGTVDVTAGGQNLSQITGAEITGEGVRVSVTSYSRPLPGKRFQEFQETLAEHRKQMAEMVPKGRKKPDIKDVGPILQEAGASEDEIRLFLIMRKQRNDPKRQDNRQLEESVTIHVEADPGAAPGMRTIRFFGKNGVSNPQRFVIGALPERQEPPATELSPPPPGPLQFPVVLNGQILPGETDQYPFRASKGEQLLFVGEARGLIPYLADAVPGWLQLALTVVDARGIEVASAQSFRFSPDPLLVFDVKQTGEYRLHVRDALYRGREDFVYRVSAGKISFVSGIAPLGAPKGSRADVKIFGWNLPGDRASITVPEEAGIYPGLLADAPSVLFESGEGIEAHAAEPDNDPAHAASVRPPVTLNGFIDKPGDVDGFALQATRGKPLALEVLARRLGSPVDALIRITDAKGNEVARADDQEDVGSALLTHHADPQLLFDPPADGLFYVWISDAQNAGGRGYPYRLRIGPPRPDFDLRITPSALAGAPGTHLPLTVHALRKGGFAGEIQLACGTPGFSISGGRIPAGKDSAVVTLGFPASSDNPRQNVTITGNADIGGAQVRHAAVPADDMLQAFFYHHLVPAEELVAFIAPGGPRVPFKVDSDVIRCATGASATIRAHIPKHLVDGLKTALINPPDGITITGTSPTADGIAITLTADAGKIKAPSSGNLLIQLTAFKPDKKDPKKINSWSAGHLPAITYYIEPPGT